MGLQAIDLLQKFLLQLDEFSHVRLLALLQLGFPVCAFAAVLFFEHDDLLLEDDGNLLAANIVR